MIFLLGNISDPINGREYATLDSMNRIHSQFQASNSLRDVTLRLIIKIKLFVYAKTPFFSL